MYYFDIHAYILTYPYVYIDQAIQRSEMNPYSPKHVRKFTAHLGPCLEKVAYLCARVTPATMTPPYPTPCKCGA